MRNKNPGEITELWTIKMADSEYLKKLVESIPRRLSDVIKREGGRHFKVLIICVLI
jgi:hypothetical protein